MFTFAFTTGIEGSAPTVANGRGRVDEMEKCGFYRHWRTDFDLVQELGLEFLRYGPPLHRTGAARAKQPPKDVSATTLTVGDLPSIRYGTRSASARPAPESPETGADPKSLPGGATVGATNW